MPSERRRRWDAEWCAAALAIPAAWGGGGQNISAEFDRMTQ
ncbi:hypothetical protein BN938_0428 [Mucinivorans hirudinis]|uniref:Uncharacterized protein n=1 Tax=Mucinivorans hirudinis TaxID=1433126 RepID=A0A060R9Q7_9BACT|nr:hypothetical protein BN938_0428 [Mucinivorans hirudinis]